MRGECRRGTALIEALIALVLLGIAGTAILTMLGETHLALASALSTERTVDSASAELDELVLLKRADLAREVGWKVKDGMAIHVEQVAPSLFDVDLARAPGRPPLLHTTLYRSDTTDAR